MAYNVIINHLFIRSYIFVLFITLAEMSFEMFNVFSEVQYSPKFQLQGYIIQEARYLRL